MNNYNCRRSENEMICEIQEEPKGQLYKELIKYAIKKVTL